MTSVEVQDRMTEVDLSQLISFSMSFQPLQLTLQEILKRLNMVEMDNAAKTEQIDRLNDEVARLRDRNVTGDVRQDSTPRAAEQPSPPFSSLPAETQPDAIASDETGEPTCTKEDTAHFAQAPTRDPAATVPSTNEVDAIWAELHRLRSLLGELQEASQRHSINELYAARKRHPSHIAGLKSPHGKPRQGSAVTVSDGVRDLSASVTRESRQHSAQNVPPPSSTIPDADPAAGGDDATGHELGDVILSKAQEVLELDGTLAYRPSHDDTAAEDAGEHMQPPARHPSEREARASRSVSAVSAPMSSTRGTGPRRSSVHPGATTGAASQSVFDALKRDGDDIAYLNRVVAEILGEMKGLHADVDLLRTQSELPLSQLTSTDAEGNVHVSQDAIAALLRRLAVLEESVAEVDRGSRGRDAELRAELEALRTTALSQSDDSALRARVTALEQRVERLQDQLVHVVRATHGEDGNPSAGASLAELGLLQGAVTSLERELDALRRGCNADGEGRTGATDSTALARLRADLDAVGVRVLHTESRCAELQEDKVSRAELDARGALVEDAEGVAAARRLSQLDDRVAEVVRRVGQLESDKADTTALHHLREELGNLKRLMELNAQREGGVRSGTDDGEGEGVVGAAAVQRLLREVQQTLNAQLETATTDRDAVREELDGLRELIDQLDHRKADATLVANKAERDYVENALERLMREVEQVLNATNAGLIDTLDKSLNILRDMIDGKATKQDIANLQQMVAEEGAGHGAADALTGFKGYRCLGCNRPIDNFRPRPLPAQMDSFLNRNPQSYPQDHVTRVIQQQQQQQPAAAPAFSGALLDHRQAGGTARQVNSGSQRSTHSEPLPPIDHAR